MIKKILEVQGASVVHNDSGANLDNGIISAFIKHASWSGVIDADWGVLETDENTLPIVISALSFRLQPGSPSRSQSPAGRWPKDSFQVKEDKKVIVVLLNLFRDQLDRYGEVDVIAEKWERALRLAPLSGASSGQALEHKDTTLILNADDPLVAHLGITSKHPVTYFGVNDKTKYLSKMEHATDSIFCLNCGGRLSYEGIYYSHIGIWSCTKCGEKRPNPDVSDWKSPIPGLYNQYNSLAAVSVAKALHIQDKEISSSLASFQPAFGRQEEFETNGKKVKIFLSKNPAGFNQSLKTVLELGATQLLFVLNDRIPDGRDVSWIWDVDFEMLPFHLTPIVSGDRAYDLAVRFKYAKPYHKLPKGAVSEPQTPILIYPDLRIALKFCLDNPNKNETLYILATYSAMLEVRKILKGRKIL